MDHERTSSTLTFLFTDLEGSTQRWERAPEAMRVALERHDELLHAAVATSGGRIVKSTGDGVMAVFQGADSALAAALAAQRAIAAEAWGDDGPLRVRMGVHSGEVQVRDEDYFGRTVNRAARIMAAGHGAQVLVSSAAAELAADELPDDARLLDLGRHRLKDLERPEHLFQLAAEGLEADFPPLRTLDSRPNNLPVDVSTFVGRSAELAAVSEQLALDPVRLLTLTGPGGTGKTRLALRVAAEHVDHFADGVFVAELAEVTDPGEVATAVVRSLGLAETSDRPAVETLRDHLAGRRLLLVLDNFEQVIAAAPVVVDLLQHSAGLKLLVTSRQPLRVRGEHVFPVPPLELPPASGAGLQELAGSEAVQLFVDRARQVQPGFTLSADNASVVAEICRRLDGLPLAIELATARLNLFSPEALLARLSDRLGILRAGAQDLPVRQQTLRDLIDWSYHLLDPGQQRLFEVLSVFSGADVDAIDDVARSLSADFGLPSDVLDTLTALVEMSLVRRVDEAALRLTMLETIREFAAERLRARPDDAAQAARAHATYFAVLAERRRPDLTGPRADRALTEVVADLDNLRAAWRFWRAARDVPRLDQLIHTLWLVADRLGRYQLTVELTTDLLEVLRDLPDAPDRDAREMTLRTTVARALLAIKGFSPEVDHAYTLALDLFDRHQLPPLFPVLRSLASHCTTTGDATRGIQLGHEILGLADREDNPSMAVDGHLVVAVNVAFGDPEQALRHLDEAVRLYRSRPYDPGPYRTGVNPGVSTLTTAALIRAQLGRPDTARDHAAEAVALAMELDHPYTLAYALFHSAYLHLWRREPERVSEQASELLELVATHDFAVWRAVGTCLLGAAETGRGDVERGVRLLDEGVSLYRRVASPPVFWPMLLVMAAAGRLAAGRPQEGMVLVDEVLGLLGENPADTFVPEVYLLKGDLVRAAGGPDGEGAADAEGWFLEAYAIADRLGLGTTRLRAATRLARVARTPVSGQAAQDRLRAAYESLAEGRDLPDAAEARALLELRGSPV